MTRLCFVTASVLVTLAVAAPARAQGKHKGAKSTPPSRTALPSPTLSSPTTTGAAPFAWIDDASVLPAGSVVGSVSLLQWQGTDQSETDVPVFGLAIGVAPRVQLGASVPRVIGSSDPSGAVGGVGTTFVSAKLGVLMGERSGVKLAVAPTVEILGTGVRQTLGAGESRTQVGLPVSLEIDRGAARVFGGAGYFSSGVWFAGGGAGVQVTRRVALSATFSRGWVSDAVGMIVHDRRDLSGGATFTVTPRLMLFGSLGTTVATSDQDGAGTTATAGVVVVLTPAATK